MRSAHGATRSSLPILLAAGVALAGSGGIAAGATVRSTARQAFLLTRDRPCEHPVSSADDSGLRRAST